MSIAADKISALRGELKALSLEIWADPEPPLQEKHAAARTAELLTNAGFDVTLGVAGLPTAIVARYGSGSPVIGFLGEYDALPGMSQKAGCAEKEPVVPGAYGHACGHSLLGTANVGAVIGAKAEMQEKNLPGTIIFYGCPAEEIAAGKGIMANAGVFDELDCCLVFHPDIRNVVQRGANVACLSVTIRYHGRTAHAGGNPEDGRSALKAIELCGIGVQFLREHLTSDVRIHYCITDGGVASNIIPDYAAANYTVRAKDMESALEVLRRLKNVAEGAALMTDTTLEFEQTSGCYDTLNNGVLGELMQRCLEQTEFEPWSEDDLALAKALNDSRGPLAERLSKAFGLAPGSQLATGVCAPNFAREMASTDAGDVMHIAPGINFGTACGPLCGMPHSWQACSAYGTEIGIKGMIYAAKAMALCAVTLLEQPQLVDEAKAEFLAQTGGAPYRCPMSPEAEAKLLKQAL